MQAYLHKETVNGFFFLPSLLYKREVLSLFICFRFYLVFTPGLKAQS